MLSPSAAQSAACRKAIDEAQRKRWAAVKNQASSTVPAKSIVRANKAKRNLTGAGRANIVAALKKRWAAKKAAGTGGMQSVAGGRKAARKAA